MRQWTRENATGVGAVVCVLFVFLLSGGDSALLHRRRRRHLELRPQRPPAADCHAYPATLAQAAMAEDTLQRIHGRYLHRSKGATRMAGDSRSRDPRGSWG